MKSLEVLLIPVLFLFVICTIVLVWSALRNRVMMKMAARNLPRRPANTVLICLGLMLAAMIFSASFATGDTLSYSIRNLYTNHLGDVDVMVMHEGTDFQVIQSSLEGSAQPTYFDEARFADVEGSLSKLIDDETVDGLAPAMIEHVPVVAETRLNEPSVTLLGFDYRYMAGFAPLTDEQGHELSLKSLEDLGPGNAYINTALAEALEVKVGNGLEVFLSSEGTPLTVRGIYKEGGNPSTFGFNTAASMVMPLSHLQSLHNPGEINFIIISNRGGSIDGAKHTDAVIEALGPSLTVAGLKAEPVKKDALDDAEEAGAMFSSIFIVFGGFSIIAGVLLIFLIFVMLAAERKHELGIARAVGTQRGHVIRLFTFEGVLYALVASAIGSGLGLAFSWGMIHLLTAAFEERGFELVYHYTTEGLIISYMLGVVFTLAVVAISAWRVSRLNIINAIKDIPEAQQPGSHDTRGLIIAILFLVAGLPMLLGGLYEKNWALYSMGASFLIIGASLISRRLHVPDRPAYTFAGAALLTFWLLPSRFHPYSGEMSGGIEMFILSGVMMVTGAVWVVMYNSDLILRAIMALFGRLRGLTPMIKTAVAYPMAARFRTGMAIAMFALIIFTLIFMSSMNASFDGLISDTDRVSGGFHIRGEVSYTNRIPDIESALTSANGVSRDDFEAIAGFNGTIVKMRDPDADKENDWEEINLLPLVGMDKAYTDNVTYDFELTTSDYATKEEVWKAITENPSLAVISPAVAPTRSAQMGGDGIDLTVGKGKFYLDDEVLPDDIYVEIQNPLTGQTHLLRVIGVVDQMAGPYASPVATSQETLAAIMGETELPTAYRFKVKPDRVDDVSELATALEKQFVENGMNTEVMAEEIKDYQKMREMFMNLMMAFMGLGLIVGIAALGVIAARSVVERRQQIGMLRAIGFRQGMIQFSFLLESSFIALLGIGVGIALGVVSASLFLPDWEIEGLKVVIPIGQIALIGGLAYLASLITTFLPAYQAARIYPAEALRYE